MTAPAPIQSATPPTLRPYQSATVDAVFGAFARGLSRVLYVLPTGTGKTVTAAEIIRRRIAADTRPALVLAHREELLVQARDTITKLIPGVTAEIERGSDRASRFAEVIVASIQTVARAGTTRLDWLAATGASVIWYDEAHHAAADGAGRVLQRFGAFEGPGGSPARSPLVGCTATPHRLDNKPLEGAAGQATFEECVYRYGLLDAIRDEWLCDLRGFVVRSETDLSGVRTVAGDFSEAELARRVNNAERNARAVKHWRELASDRPTIAFCADVDHARDAAEAWLEAGVSAAHVDGSMHRDERRAVLDRFRRGEVQVLANCQIATEGFDHPPVSCVVMLRPTKSWSLYAQMAGRGTRLFPGKEDCLVIDVVDNCDHHSLVTAPRLADLPAGVDLEGESLSRAREELEEIGDRAAHVPARPGKWRELLTVALEVPLFAVPETPAEVIAAHGRLRWLKLPQGYYLDCGEKRRMWLRETPLGWQAEAVWTADVFGEAKDLAFPLPPRADFADALTVAEGWVGREWPSARRVASQTAAWRTDPPTEKQVLMLQKLARKRRVAGFDVSKVADKGQASALISQWLNEEDAARRAKAEAMAA